MARITNAVRERQNAQAQYARESAAMKRDRDMVEVPLARPTKQTAKAVHFVEYGWVPAIAIRWRQFGTGVVLPWSCGRETDTLMIAREFVR